MKKKYLSPAMQAQTIAATSMVCTSLNSNLNGDESINMDPNNPTDPGEGRVRQRTTWRDDDYYDDDEWYWDE